MLWIRRTPLSIAFQAATPFSLLFVLFVVSGGQYTHFAVAGSLVMALVGTGLAVGSDITNYRTEYKIQDIFVSSPVSSLTYMMGVALGQLVYHMPSLIVLSILVMSVSISISLVSIPLLIATVLVVWASMAAIGFFVSSHVRHTRQTAYAINTLNIALAVLPPVFYSIDMLPFAELQYLAYAFPATHASLTLQQIMGLATPTGWSLGIGFAVQIAYLVGFFLLAKAKSTWREN